ncbi:MAG: glutathione S-transferase family protein [Alphaproteobacteria bacterium]|nr:glutathione S-transferase family protein [Alphaproteobacteria bacterium]
MLKIYGIAQSRAFRVLWMAEELGLPYEQVKVGFENMKVVDPRLHALNPNRKLPAIDDDGTVLFESLAINLYLADKAGGPLRWANAAEAGRCYQWSLWAANEMEPKSQAWGYEKFMKPEGQRDAKAIAAAAEGMAAPLSVLQTTLAGRSWLAADRFTVADCNAAGVLYRLLWFEGLAKFDKVKDWLDRCYARPAALRARKMREG